MFLSVVRSVLLVLINSEKSFNFRLRKDLLIPAHMMRVTRFLKTDSFVKLLQQTLFGVVLFKMSLRRMLLSVFWTVIPSLRFVD